MTTLVADFNSIDEQGRIWLPGAERADVHTGERVLLTDGDVEVEAILEYDAGRHIWVGEVERQTLAHFGSNSGLPIVTR